MENKVQLINAEPIKKFIVDGLNNPDLRKAFGHDAIEILAEIEYAPIVDAVPVVHSRWKFNANGSGTCENCHFTQRAVWDYDNHQRYCGVCGARMDLEEVK